MMPIAQAIGEKTLVLLELVPRRGVSLEAGEEAYIGEENATKCITSSEDCTEKS